MVATISSISLTLMIVLRLFSGASICAAPDFIDDVDRLVGQLAVAHVARRQDQPPL